MKKALRWSVPMCTVAAGIALAVPAAAVPAAVAQSASPAHYTTFPGRFYSVAAVSASNVWAAGLGSSGSLIAHWNGSQWSQSVSGAGYFFSIGDSSSSNVWAVGGTNWFSPSQPFAEHFNGSSWTHSRTPSPAGGGFFRAVAATSSSNAWAVGLVGPGPGVPSPTTPLIEHWNGGNWTIQHYQAVAHGGQFDAVAATSSSNAWAVGWTGPSSEGTGQQTLIEHWNGRTWTRVPSPNLGSTGSYLVGMTTVSADDAWAAGFAVVDGICKTLVLHWNGRHWTLVPGATLSGDNQLFNVTATGKHDVWAVGMTNPTTCANPQCQTLVEHGNRTRWKVISSPNPSSYYLNALWGISAVSRSDIWAVGSTDYESTLIMHWNGTSWSY